jgi:LPXTG-motif cell wall-anchored protein
MGLFSKASSFLNKTIVGKGISALAPKATTFVKSVGAVQTAQKSTVKAVQNSSVAQKAQSTNQIKATAMQPTIYDKIKSFFLQYWMYVLGATIVATLAYFFLFKKKKVVRRNARRK